VAANEAFERLASLGLMPNMILYLTREYGMQTAAATNFLLLWSAASNFAPFIGAVLADSYVGRYSMIAFGSVASLLVIFFLLSSDKKVLNCNRSFVTILSFQETEEKCDFDQDAIVMAKPYLLVFDSLTVIQCWSLFQD